MELIDLDNLDEISDIPSTSNFGSGIELLMNDKKVSSSNVDLNLGELDNMENELNQISGNTTSTDEKKTISGMASNLFGFNTETSIDAETLENETIKMDSENPSDSNIGQATRESVGNTSTWDGFSKMNEIPLERESKSSSLSDREKRRKKRAMLKKLDEWYEKGLIKHNSHFDMESNFDEVEDEYETAMEDKRTKDSVKLQGWWFMTFINSLEYANTVFNPFDLNLDGWGEQINEDLDSYEEIFSELHDKYKGGKLAPELSLLLRVGFSGAVLNFSNKALSSATPAFNDVIKQSPELMKMFTNATVNTMSDASPGFAMANNLMEETANRPRGPPPPASMKTKEMPPTERPGNRPDINASRGSSTMFREQGVDMNSGYDINQQQQSIRTPSQPPAQRKEMRGPQNTDIDNILSGLKTRKVDIREQKQTNNAEESSVISISSLKDMQNNNMPKSKRRKNKSDKNTVTLDI